MFKKSVVVIVLFLLVSVAFVVTASPVLAAVTGFVAKGADGSYYKYPYDELLDSYALSLLGESNGLYADYAAKEVYALKDSNNGYIDYEDVIMRYAEALALGKVFDLNAYTGSSKARKAQLPSEIKLVRLNDGGLEYSSITTISHNPLADYKPPRTKTPLVGAAGASVEQAQKWAQNNEAHQRLIDIAPTYWDYAERTGIRPEVLFVQAALQTDFGNYFEGAPASSNNWAGILKKDSKSSDSDGYEKFSNPEEGVRAHFNHMAAYTGLKPIGEPHDRYHVVLEQSWAGAVINVDDLSGKWVSDERYHYRILFLLDELKNTVVDQKPEEKDPVDTGEEDKKQELDPGKFEHVAVDVSEVTVLHLRSGPSTDHDILDRLVRGTVLEVIGGEGKWLEVVTPRGKKGWVHGDYVKAVDLSANPFKGKKVVIDPGHGGLDTGAIGITGLLEKEVTIDVAERLKIFLENAGAVVVMTREGDRSVSNSRRVNIANDAKADVFISIHANAFSNPDSNGTETFYCSNNSSRDASRYLAQQLQRELIEALGRRDRGVKTRSFFVIKETKMPSALVELAFLTNKEEEALLRKPEGRAASAEALFKGLEAYFRKHR